MSENPSSSDVIRYFKGKCVVCGHPAHATHEIEPRSRGNNPMRFENRVALCIECHEFFHSRGITESAIQNLKFIRANRIQVLYGENPPPIESFYASE